jgi:hypothetical protein
MTIAHDPLNINARLYNQIGKLLDDLEAEDVKNPIDIKARIAALIAVGRLQTIFVGLRKEKLDGPARGAGSAVRKYSKAFKADAGRGRKKNTRGRAVAAGGDDFADDDGDDDAG